MIFLLVFVVAQQGFTSDFCNSSGSFAKFTAIRLASSFVSNFAADHRPSADVILFSW
jgi:hypothetical protein